jgi:hypothetical protein
MAFDIYVGTMTRFYRREWENIAQRTAREQGIEYTMIYANGNPLPPPPADEIRQAVASWCEALSQGLKLHGFGPVTWNESNDNPYFTDRPAWDGYSALLVWAAHDEHPDLPLPEKVPETWADDPAYQRSIDREFKSHYTTILMPELWLPTQFPFSFESPTLVSEKGWIGSTFTLKQQLDDLRERTTGRFQELKAVEKKMKPKVRKTGFFKSMFTRKQEDRKQTKPTLVEAAEFGLSIFSDLANKACEHQLPILLSF